MRTNKACPRWTGEEEEECPENINVAMTLEDEEKLDKKLDDNNEESLVNVTGTKIKFSEKVLRHAEEMRRKAVQIKIPKVNKINRLVFRPANFFASNWLSLVLTLYHAYRMSLNLEREEELELANIVIIWTPKHINQPREGERIQLSLSVPSWKIFSMSSVLCPKLRPSCFPCPSKLLQIIMMLSRDPWIYRA